MGTYEEKPHYLKDKFFLTFKYFADGSYSMSLQGRILDIDYASSGKMFAVCQLYSWIAGEPTDIILFNIDDMLTIDDKIKFKFYSSHEDFVYAAENRNHGCRKDYAQDDIQSIYEEIIIAINDNGGNITHRDLNRKFQHRIKNNDMMQYVIKLIENGDILRTETCPENGGTKTVTYSTAR